MGERRKSREYALQLLYQIEMGGGKEEALATFWNDKHAPQDVKSFAELLVRGTLENLSEIDSVLRSGLENWRLSRIAAVDRSVLRLAVFEFLHQTETPPVVVIDEAIELAKRFGGEESGEFVNGVLDGIRKSRGLRPSPQTPQGQII
jgi:N utilization substance protein B